MIDVYGNDMNLSMRSRRQSPTGPKLERIIITAVAARSIPWRSH